MNACEKIVAQQLNGHIQSVRMKYKNLIDAIDDDGSKRKLHWLKCDEVETAWTAMKAIIDALLEGK